MSHPTINLFHPTVSQAAILAVTDVLNGRWIGQGPRVDAFERKFQEYVGCPQRPVAVGAGTDALHLAYILAGIGPGSEVVAPVFSCAATNVPLLYQRATIRFADIQADTFNVDPDHVRELTNERTRAIVCVHYGGLPCDLDALQSIADRWGIPLIEDAAQALGATYHHRPIGAGSSLAAFSFQAVKHFTTGDGGMLVASDPASVEKARRLRWFGIDRVAKHEQRWDGNISEVGYKYQMTDIAAAMGLEGLNTLEALLARRRQLFDRYRVRLQRIPGLSVVGGATLDHRTHAAWLFTVSVPDAADLQRKLAERCIESSPVHYRNDAYKIFFPFQSALPQMDRMEGRYLSLPLHTHLSDADVDHICDVIAS